MTIRNRELSQFGSFIYVENSTQEIGITTESLPYVGIGTTNPQQKLDVVGNVRINGDTNITGLVSATSYYLNGSPLVSAVLQSWDIAGADAFRINGNVGIGTSVITEKLEVVGNAKASTFISTVTTGTSPFVVNSQTLVTNLNSDYLRGKTPPTGDIVGTTDSQTLTNKTLTSPIISTIVNSGTLTLPTVTGTLVSTGDTAVVTSNMIADLSITNADIAVGAGITYGKLSLTSSITNADIVSAAGIPYSKLSLSNSITNADIAVGAGITNGKLATSTISGVSLGSNLNDLNAGSFVTYDSGTTYNGSTSKTISVNATSSNTSSTIVSRDASGNFSAGTITASLTGNVSGDCSGSSGSCTGNSASADQIKTTTRSTAATHYLTFVDSDNGSATAETLYTDAGITYNPSTNDLTASGNVTAYSDVSLKENIETISNALEMVNSLRGVRFNRKDLEGNPLQIGVIAQEVEKIVPEVVKTADDGLKSVAYGNLIGVLIEAIKELSDKVDELSVNR